MLNVFALHASAGALVAWQAISGCAASLHHRRHCPCLQAIVIPVALHQIIKKRSESTAISVRRGHRPDDARWNGAGRAFDGVDAA
jgi:hypothetical protein